MLNNTIYTKNIEVTNLDDQQATKRSANEIESGLTLNGVRDLPTDVGKLS